MDFGWRKILYWSCLGLSSLAFCRSNPDSLHAASDAVRSPAAQAVNDLDDHAGLLSPAALATESEDDRQCALAHFSAGLSFERRGKEWSALRSYQRALRYAPGAVAPAQSLIPLAERLGRIDLAAQAAIAASQAGHHRPPADWARLAAAAAAGDDAATAISLYEKAKSARDEPDKAVVLLWTQELGRLYLKQGKTNDAANQFEAVVAALERPSAGHPVPIERLFAQPGRSLALMGETLLQAGRPRAALKAFRLSQSLSPDPAGCEYFLAQEDFYQGRWGRALARLEKALPQATEEVGVGPYRLLKQVLDRCGRSDELIDRLLSIRLAKRQSPVLDYFLAAEYEAWGRFVEAACLYRDLIQTAPTLSGVRRLLLLDVEAGRFHEVIETLAVAVSAGVTAADLGSEGRAFLANENAVNAIFAVARPRLACRPALLDWSECRALAALALEADSPQTAAEFFDAALELSPGQSGPLFVEWAEGLLAHGHAAEAIDVLRRGLHRPGIANGEVAALRDMLAGALAECLRTGEALNQVDLAAGLSGAATAWYASRRGWILYKAERWDEACAAYSALVRDYDDSGEAEIREVLRGARLVLSNICVRRGQWPQAAEWLEQVLDEYPEDLSARNDLAYLWAERREHPARSYAMASATVASDPENAAYRDTLGWVLCRQGRYDEAIRQLEQAAHLAADPVVLDHLGEAACGGAAIEKARAAWQASIALFQRQGRSAEAAHVALKLTTKLASTADK